MRLGFCNLFPKPASSATATAPATATATATATLNRHMHPVCDGPYNAEDPSCTEGRNVSGDWQGMSLSCALHTTSLVHIL